MFLLVPPENRFNPVEVMNICASASTERSFTKHRQETGEAARRRLASRWRRHKQQGGDVQTSATQSKLDKNL